MLTQAVPSIVQALQDVLPPQALKQLTQALGNCQQPLTHRGDVSIAGNDGQNGRDGRDGIVPDGPWPPDRYRDIIPSIDRARNVDIPGFRPDAWNLNNYLGSQFHLPINQFLVKNQYLGGPTLNVGGNSYFNNAYTNNLTTNNVDARTINTRNISVTSINNYPTTAEPGPPGEPGPEGPPGADGEIIFIGGRPQKLKKLQLPTVTHGEVKFKKEKVKIATGFDPEKCELIFKEKTLITDVGAGAAVARVELKPGRPVMVFAP